MSTPSKILIIDDNEEILVALKNFLNKKDYVVVTASNGLDGLKLFEAAHDDYDLVITDLVMPNIGGVALISMFKNQTPDLPIIAITGYGEQPESLAREARADVVLEKPFKLTISLTLNTPLVRVPVLSNTTVFTFARASIKLDPLTKIPLREASPIPAK